MCTVDVVVSEGNDVTRVDVCGVKQREKDIYTSIHSTISLDVAVHRRMNTMPKFIIKYRGKRNIY